MNILLGSILAQSEAAGLPWQWWLGPIGALAALGTAYYLYTAMMREAEGTEKMIEIAQAVREGAMAYLRAQYRYVAYVFAGLFLVFFVLSMIGAQRSFVMIAFVTAGLSSGIAGFIGMRTATNASARTANATGLIRSAHTAHSTHSAHLR
jgi:K(+)-stimulated pyrophosphate-energized sodium pump